MIFLMAPKDIQENSDYERALELLKQEHGEDSVAPDRELFASDKESKESWKEVYGEADGVYILAREDGRLGSGCGSSGSTSQSSGYPPRSSSREAEIRATRPSP